MSRRIFLLLSLACVGAASAAQQSWTAMPSGSSPRGIYRGFESGTIILSGSIQDGGPSHKAIVSVDPLSGSRREIIAFPNSSSVEYDPARRALIANCQLGGSSAPQLIALKASGYYSVLWSNSAPRSAPAGDGRIYFADGNFYYLDAAENVIPLNWAGTSTQYHVGVLPRDMLYNPATDSLFTVKLSTSTTDQIDISKISLGWENGKSVVVSVDMAYVNTRLHPQELFELPDGRLVVSGTRNGEAVWSLSFDPSDLHNSVSPYSCTPWSLYDIGYHPGLGSVVAIYSYQGAVYCGPVPCFLDEVALHPEGDDCSGQPVSLAALGDLVAVIDSATIIP